MRHSQFVFTVILLCISILHTISAHADERTHAIFLADSASTALRDAFIDLEHRNTVHPKGTIRFAYIRDETEKDGTKDKENTEIKSYIQWHYDPALPYDQRIILDHPTEIEDEIKHTQILKALPSYPQTDVEEVIIFRGWREHFSSDIVDETASTVFRFYYLKEEGNNWVFTTTLPKKTLTELGFIRNLKNTLAQTTKGTAQEPSQSNKYIKSIDKMLASLQVEIFIDKTDHYFSGARVYTTKSGKYKKSVKLKKIDVLWQFAPAWPNGPLVSKKETTKIQMKFLAFKVGNTATIKRSKFEQRK